MKIIRTTDGYETLVDDDAYELLSMVPWHTAKPKGSYSRYVQRAGPTIHRGQLTIHLHRVVVSCPTGMEVDHIDCDGLNNQRSNLRVCTHSENMRNRRVRVENSSGVSGVNWRQWNGMWEAQISIDSVQTRLGFFSSFDRAVVARKEAEAKYFGEYAKKEE